MKNKKEYAKATPKNQAPAGISKLGRKVIFSGIAVLILGFIVLTKTDPSGQNLASMVSPFLILGGYLIIGIGIFVPDKDDSLNDINAR
jgi:hypothetical protein